MLMTAKTKLDFDTDWLESLKFKEHNDSDLAGYVDAVAIKSWDGDVYSFYRPKPIEDPKDYRYTRYYNKCKSLVDYFQFETSRVRIHRQMPGKTLPLHTDDNNIEARNNDDFRLRAVTALTSSPDFIYTFQHNNEIEQFTLKKGETVVFDPDLVAHGMMNQSKTEIRYALVQVFKAYPVTPWLKTFLNTEQTIEL